VKVRIQSSCSGALGLPAAALVLSLCVMGSVVGCASAQSSPLAVVPVDVAAARASTAPPEASTSTSMPGEDDAQRTAQHVWCKYLEALFLRSTEGAKIWPRFAQCDVVRTPAAPAMLRRTAECSMAALQKFEGDPFTPEYAAEVTRCGRESLDATTMSDGELAPFVKTICARAVACGSATDGDCRLALVETLGPNLRRAIGAINPRGRGELRACLESAACDAMSDQITGCLTPIMDRLLWLPE
jgi:hypothetical protein